MNPQSRPIFRASAVQGYMQARSLPVLPRLISPPVSLCLWLLTGILLVGGALVGLTPVPVYGRGEGVVVEGEGVGAPGGLVLVAFFTPETLPGLRVGQRVVFGLGPGGEPRVGNIIAVDPQVQSPADLRRRFRLTGAADPAPARPSAVALARFDTPPENLPPQVYVGSRSDVEVEVGSRRVISFFPFVGRFFVE